MRFRKEAPETDSDWELPETLIKVLNALESKSFIVSSEERIVYQSENLDSFGITKDGNVILQDLVALMRVVRRTQETHKGLLEVPRGPIGEGKRLLQISVIPLSSEGAVLALLTDESEARRIDAVRRDFVANVSHELKTPIGALGLLSEAVLGAREEPEEVVRFATRMQGEVRRLTELVQEIIDLSRLQSSDPLQQAFPVTIADVVNEAIAQAQLSAETRRISLEANRLDDATVIGDRSQLIMAIHNLIENAINYSPENTKVSITARRRDELVEVSVADQGIGIPDDEQSRIFERFYRVDPARSRSTGGTGLGLSIVKHVALNHGGDVKVWSKTGVGSTFSLLLPITKSEFDEEAK